MKIALPDPQGHLVDYTLTGTGLPDAKLPERPARVVYSAAHVVADPFTANDPSGPATVDWEATLRFRRYLAGLGLGIAEAMDTAQRGMGLDWHGALELIRRTRAELPEALVANGCGTDHLDPAAARSVDDVKRAYMEQLEAIQKLDARVILMSSRALARVAAGPADYVRLYGEMHRFIPALAVQVGGTVTEVPVNHHARQYGSSKYGISRTVRVMLDLITVWFLGTYATRPIHVFGGLGLLSTFLGVLLGVYLTFVKLFMHENIGSRPLLMLAVLLVVVGVQLITMGLLGEMIIRTYYESQGKPIYYVRTVVANGEATADGKTS